MARVRDTRDTSQPVQDIADALDRAGICYVRNALSELIQSHLHFFLYQLNIYIHYGNNLNFTGVLEQHENIIIIQGPRAAKTFARIITKDNLIQKDPS